LQIPDAMYQRSDWCIWRNRRGLVAQMVNKRFESRRSLPRVSQTGKNQPPPGTRRVPFTNPALRILDGLVDVPQRIATAAASKTPAIVPVETCVTCKETFNV